MRKQRAHGGPMSRLPEDETYWEALTSRLVTDAADQLSAYRSARTRWWRGLARLSTPLTVGAAAAVVAALLWLPEVADEPTGVTLPATLYGFAPNDPLAALFVTSAEAPTMATLLATPTKEGAR
ncbi:MAG: hypothetical protein HY337_00200 [Gemmatimonadetes bacterium]|nr:hypothetical protein [Gemmatimonadota bacterium]